MKTRDIFIIISAMALPASCHRNLGGMPEQTLKTMQVCTSDRTLYSEYSASVKGRQDVDVYPEVTGKITDILIEEGARVRKGQTLFIIDQVPYRSAAEVAAANLESAEAELASAELTCNSKRALYEENVVSEYDLQQAVNSVNSAKAALAQARAQLTKAGNELSYTEVKSPVDGHAGMFNYRTGAYVGPSSPSPLVSVTDDEYMHVYFSMSEKQMLSMSSGKALDGRTDVELSLSDGSGYGHKGTIDAISGIIDRGTGSIAMRATFPNPDGRLRSGGNATVRIPYELKGCIVIPQEATFEIQDRKFVYKIIDGVARSSEISVFPISSGKEYIVTEGLAEGETIVSEGAGLVREGQSAGQNGRREEI
ncbi:MAG: efflux RND transporter periplasmic adaptor subunit [Candidatus Cryptobacteroides sp.]